MGTKAREIISGDKEWIINTLKKAYAHEWVVHYYAALASKLVSGPHAATFEKIFEGTAESEFKHTNLIADRLAELGEEPPRDLDEIQKLAGTGKIELPSNLKDMNAFLMVFIKLEQHAIELYKELVKEAHKRGLKIILDHVSNHIGINHSWIKNLPTVNWLNGTPDNHTKAKLDKMAFIDIHGDSSVVKFTTDGWFQDYMPDLNQRNSLLKRYLIQNTLWWIEYSSLDGIREDTYPYSDQQYLVDWAEAILNEYPNSYDKIFYFNDWYIGIAINWKGKRITEAFYSMEQLWLALIMKEKFGKVWVNDKWSPESKA